MQSRRRFFKTFGSVALLTGMGALPLKALAKEPEFMTLTILHTNDVHSRIEPFESGRNAGYGGVARRAALIKKVRSEQENVLLLDAGDIFQGTPYFNFFGGELEFKLMEEMRYDAATIGNHDFDIGVDGLHKQLPNISFPLINGNYDFSDTIMNGSTKPYQIFQKGAVRIGILGIGIELEGLVPKSLYKNTIYLDPIERANHYASILKNDEKCDYVICLSHIGYSFRNDPNRVNDKVLAASSKDIDLILGGHTHTFMREPDLVENKNGEPIMIHQVGWAGIVLGRIDVVFEKNNKKRCSTCKNQLVKPE
jgi:5'-nucleotidase